MILSVFKRIIWAAVLGLSLPHPPGIPRPQKTSVVISFSMVGVHKSLENLRIRSNTAIDYVSISVEFWGSLLATGMPTDSSHIYCKPHMHHRLSDTVLSHLLVFWLLFHLGQNLVQGQEVLFIGLFKNVGIWHTTRGPLVIKKESKMGAFGGGGPCPFTNLAVYKLDCAV